jgi:hypothetical protein
MQFMFQSPSTGSSFGSSPTATPNALSEREYRSLPLLAGRATKAQSES